MHEVIAAGVGANADLGRHRMPSVGDELKRKVIEADRSRKACLYPGANLGRRVKARTPKGLQIAVEGEHRPRVQVPRQPLVRTDHGPRKSAAAREQSVDEVVGDESRDPGCTADGKRSRGRKPKTPAERELRVR